MEEQYYSPPLYLLNLTKLAFFQKCYKFLTKSVDTEPLEQFKLEHTSVIAGSHIGKPKHVLAVKVNGTLVPYTVYKK